MRNSTIPTNEELVQQRLTVAREKKMARDRSCQESAERNLKLKEILHSKGSGDFVVPSLYAIKVSVCEELRRDLKLSGREKRGRVFVEKGTEAAATLKALKFEMHAFFRALRKSSFIMSAGFPEIAPDGTVLSSGTDVDSNKFWSIATDEDVEKTFAAADEFFAENDAIMKRPSILVHVSRDPNAPLPPPPPAYLEGMAKPSESPTMTMLSFYSFPPNGIADPEDFALKVRKAWKPFEALGRVYVAAEGVNAQMSVPTNVLDNFIQCCRSLPELGQHMENGINIDPMSLTREEFAVAGVPADGKATPPFRNLHVRVRNQIVADGLDRPLDWQSAGYDMPPLEWHKNLKKSKEDDETAPIILDCRNNYETDVGRFEGAEPLDTENFRESWDVLKDRLVDTPKDAPLFTYCTGGIRCVKVGAYLTQELGFTNVNRLAGGIIAYDRTLAEKAAEEESLFKGTNFVFDGRLGRAITEDALGTCLTCGSETSFVSNCRNGNCHKRMVQCEKCLTDYHGTCSDACKNRISSASLDSDDDKDAFITDDTASATTRDIPSFTNLDDYSQGHSSPLPSLYPEMEFNTRALIPSGSHMVSGASQGRLLTQLASMTREGRILELGTFTGYATACLLEGAANAGTIANLSGGCRQGGPYVMSMERDLKALEVAVAHLEIMSRHGLTEEAAEAAAALRSGGTTIPVVTEEVTTLDYQGVATCELVRVTDALAVLEEIAAGRGDLQPVAPFDLVFVDADKTRLLEYATACLETDLLKPGGLLVVDNVLWKGLVLEAANKGEDFSSLETEEADHAEIRRNRRARKLANKMHRFNSDIVRHPRAEVLVLPVRDGLSLIRKKH
jgi:predicted sulfurtransferase/predicted O-methyltransferase YrrM